MNIVYKYNNILRPYGGTTLFFTKNNFGFNIKALNTNYKPVLLEFKNII